MVAAGERLHTVFDPADHGRTNNNQGGTVMILRTLAFIGLVSVLVFIGLTIAVLIDRWSDRHDES